MKRLIHYPAAFWLSIVFFLLFTGWFAYSDQGGVVQVVKHATKPIDDSKNIGPMPPLWGDTVVVAQKYPGGVFRTQTRKDKMTRFQCSQCHDNKTTLIPDAAKMAHGDIALTHGGVEGPTSCFTCHKKDERDYLKTEDGMKVDMDHSYQLCGQCHFRQKKDWTGGAHGKRVTYWAGERVVKNCTECHNPHAPRFKKRWPKTYSLPLD